MNESTLESYWRDDGILFITARDTSQATVDQWLREALDWLEQTNKYSKRLYDLRQLDSLSIMALRTAIRLKSHRNAKYVFAAILTRSSRTASLVQTVLSIQPGGNFRIMFDENEAITWLNTKVAPEESFRPIE